MRTIEVRSDVDNATLEQLQAAMEAAPNKRSYIRLAAMRCLLRGLSRQDVSGTFCRSDRMVRL